MNLRDMIYNRIEELNWSQSDLARATGIPRQNISDILQGTRPMRAIHVLLLDSVLNLGMDYGSCIWQ